MAMTGMSTFSTAALMAWTSELVIAGAIGGFVGGFVASGGNLKAALIGGVTGAAFGFIGGSEIFGVRGGFTVERAVAHGTAGGISSELSGGKFIHGFASSFVAKTTAGKIAHYFRGNPIGGAVASAVVGGATSSAMGGKFANGAITAAFAYMFNKCFSGDGCVGGREPGSVGSSGVDMSNKARLRANGRVGALIGVEVNGEIGHSYDGSRHANLSPEFSYDPTSQGKVGASGGGALEVVMDHSGELTGPVNHYSAAGGFIFGVTYSHVWDLHGNYEIWWGFGSVTGFSKSWDFSAMRNQVIDKALE